MTTTDQQPDSEQFLIGAGLLPPTENNDYVAMSPDRTPMVSPLEPYYENVMHALARDVVGLRTEIEIQQDRRYELQRQAGRLHTAVRWLRDVHEFNELTQRVIAHVLDEEG